MSIEPEQKDDKNSLDTMAARLSGELKPMRALLNPFFCCARWYLFSVVYVVAVLAFWGVRPDALKKLADPVFAFEVTLSLLLSAVAALATAYLRIPGKPGQQALTGATFLLLGVLFAWMGWRATQTGLYLPGISWSHCFESSFFFFVLPAFFLVIMIRQGATTVPHLSSFMAIVAVGGLGYAAQRFVCMADTVGHGFFLHLVPFLALGGLMGILARRLYSW